MKFNRRQLNLWGIPQVEETIVPSMPYMGSKRKLANKILNAIYQTVGDFDTLYDLFGGGGAMSVAAILAGHKTIYNELNPAIARLFKHVLSGGELPKEWISREEFHAKINGGDWQAGLLQTCWSFGNNQKDYLYGKEVEPLKKLAHELCINKSESARAELSAILGIEVPLLKKARDLSSFFRTRNDRFDMQHLENINRLEHLERLQHLESLQHLEILNLGYDAVITESGIVYCDPPYQDTAEYKEGLNHADFWEWVKNHRLPVFVSEYSAPVDFAIVAEFEHRSTLSSTNNAKVTIEKLFWNGVKQ